MLPYNFYYSKSGGHELQQRLEPDEPDGAARGDRGVGAAARQHRAERAGSRRTTVTRTTSRRRRTRTRRTRTSSGSRSTRTRRAPCRTRSTRCGRSSSSTRRTSIVSTAHANPDGTHSDWSTPLVLPTRDGKPWDSYLLPHVAPDGTVYTTITNGPPQQGFSHADIDLISSQRLRPHLAGPAPGRSQGITARHTRTRPSARGSSTRSRSGTSAASQRRALPALRLVRGRLERALERLSDRFLRRRPRLDGAVPGQRQRRPRPRRCSRTWRRRRADGRGRVLRPAAPLPAGRQPEATSGRAPVRPEPAVRRDELLRQHRDPVLHAGADADRPQPPPLRRTPGTRSSPRRTPAASAAQGRSSATTSASTRTAADVHDLRLDLQRRREPVATTSSRSSPGSRRPDEDGHGGRGASARRWRAESGVRGATGRPRRTPGGAESPRSGRSPRGRR